MSNSGSEDEDEKAPIIVSEVVQEVMEPFSKLKVEDSQGNEII